MEVLKLNFFKRKRNNKFQKETSEGIEIYCLFTVHLLTLKNHGVVFFLS